MQKIKLLFLSFFGVGYMPKAPGTWGTLAALPLIYLWSRAEAPWWLSLSVITLLTWLACLVADQVQREGALHDPQWIVIDEVLGMALTWEIAGPLSLLEWGLCFGAFRFFDIIKIWPASFFDQKIKNGYGTILDDIVSGVYAGIFSLTVSHYFLRP